MQMARLKALSGSEHCCPKQFDEGVVKLQLPALGVVLTISAREHQVMSVSRFKAQSVRLQTAHVLVLDAALTVLAHEVFCEGVKVEGPFKSGQCCY